jgi:hypothetical protein
LIVLVGAPEEIRTPDPQIRSLEVANAMFRIEQERVKFLSQRAAIDFGLTEWDSVYKEMMDLAEARKLSLSPARIHGVAFAAEGYRPVANYCHHSLSPDSQLSY